MVKWLLGLGLLLYTLAEIALLVEIGSRVGLAWMLVWTVASALLGLFLLRVEGIRGIVRIHHQLQQQVLPTRDLVDMAMIVVGALLLVAPGILSDAMGLLLLVPPTRWVLRETLLAVLGRGAFKSAELPPSDEVIEIEAQQVRD